MSNKSKPIPHMKSLSDCLEKVNAEGYSDQFVATGKGLRSVKADKEYYPHEIKIIDFYRFEGISDPDDSSVLYVIETSDGQKDTLTDAYGMYADTDVARLMAAVDDIQKKGVEKK